jgi:hypothetical protein
MFRTTFVLQPFEHTQLPPLTLFDLFHIFGLTH